MSLNGGMIEFSYSSGIAQGYLVKPFGSSLSNPSLLVIHEWWGLEEHRESIADRFSKEGYVVLAPDMYDGVSTKNPDEAGKLMQALEQKRGLSIISGAINYLEAIEDVDENRIGITGFCMGGTFSLLMVCNNSKIKASAPFYGDVPAEGILKGLSAPVLFIGAENDFWITRDILVEPFESSPPCDG